MINVSSLKKGNIVKILVENKGMGLREGDTLRVFETGYSRSDRMDYADCKTDKGYTFQIMKNYRDFELVC
jgi:sensor histidine kinase regulating citrate/malate metabolism